MATTRDIARKLARQTIGNPSATALFAGPNASDADQGMLARAKEMDASGANRDDIWRDTGWFKDGDAWSFESSPSEPPGYRKPEIGKGRPSVPLSSVSDDPAFARSYPGLADMPVIDGNKGMLGPGDAAMYLPKAGRPAPYIAVDARNPYSPRASYFIQHEKQHAVDDAEGALVPTMQADQALPWERKTSERRAVNAGYRDVHMTPDERKASPPWVTEDIAFQKMHPQYAGSRFPANPAAKGDPDMASPPRMPARRAGVPAQTLDDVMSGGGSGGGRASQETPVLASYGGEEEPASRRIARRLGEAKPQVAEVQADRIAVSPLAEAMVNGVNTSDPLPFRRAYVNWLSRKDPGVVESHLKRMPIGTDTEADDADIVQDLLDSSRRK